MTTGLQAVARTRIKVCGLARSEDVRAVVEAGADAAGFVMVPGSPRYVSPDDVALLAGRLPPFVTPVAVVDLTDPLDTGRAEALRQVVASGIRCIQFHGFEAPYDIQRWKLTLSIQVIKTIHLHTRADIAALATFEAHVDAFLLAEKDEQGRSENWELAAEAVLACSKPVILAGGLTPANVARALSQVRPFGVEVSSAVESASGIKDLGKLSTFVRAVQPVAPTL